MKPLADIGDPAAPAGSPEWCKYIHGLMCQTKQRANSEVSSLKYTLIEFKTSQHWKFLTDANDRPFMTWEDYVQYPEPDGLGMAVAIAEAIIAEQNDKRLLADIEKKDKANLRPRGRPKKNDDADEMVVINKRASPTGNSVEKALRVLRDKRPDIHARVLADEISPHAGMIEAGFRKKRESKKLTALERIATHVAKLSDDEWEQLKYDENQRRRAAA
jgi:hypothetical protein